MQPAAVRLARLPRLVALCAWRDSVTWWSLRSFLVTLVAGQAVAPLLGLVVWSSVLPGRDGIAVYYTALLAVVLATASFENHTVSNGIYDGTFGDFLLQPKPPVVGSLGTSFAMRGWHVVFGLPLVAVVAWVSGGLPGAEGTAAAVPAVLLAGAVRFAFTYALALTAFWTQRAHGVVGIGESSVLLLGGTAAPIALMPDQLDWVYWALPFWSMLGAPADLAAGTSPLSAPEVWALQAAWLAVCTGLAVLVWRIGIRRFTALGG